MTLGVYPASLLEHGAFGPLYRGAGAVGVRMDQWADVDVLHLHWPENTDHKPLHRRWLALRMLAKARRNGARIVWWRHNTHPHLGRRLPLVLGALRHHATTVVSLRPTDAFAYDFIVPHPAFDVDRSPPKGKAQRIIGVGYLRRNKGIPSLIQQALEQFPAATIDLYGQAEGDDWAGLFDALGPRVTWHPGRVDDGTVAQLLKQADLWLAPARDNLNSGQRWLAWSAGVPHITNQVDRANGLPFDPPEEGAAAGEIEAHNAMVGAAFAKLID